jgi:hypothetical protein
MAGRRASLLVGYILLFTLPCAGIPALAHALPLPQVSGENVRDVPSESMPLNGPAGLQGWTLNYPLPDRPQELYPRILVISRNGRVIQRIAGQHYIWKWIFWDGGRQIAYEDGPPHSTMRCVLVDLKTGLELENYDCFSGLPKKAPLWLESLEKVH